MKKKLLLSFILITVAVTLVYLYAYKNHRNIATETADFSITVSNLQKEFTASDSVATQKYQDKAIQISGKLTSIDVENKAIVVDEKVYANFLKTIPDNLTVGKLIIIKGRFLGYDDLVEEFKIDQTVIVE